MKGRGIRLSPRMRFWFYGIFGVLFLSGVIWLVTPSAWLLSVHGGAAMASLVVLGVLIPSHMQRGWAQQRNRRTAVLMIAVCLAMVLSGYGLYYCGNDHWRSWISGAHSFAGCALPFALVWHIINGRKSKARPTMRNKA